jgi:hypothetical protein
MQLNLLDLWRQGLHDLLHRPLPTLQNTDGEPFVLTRDDFTLLAPRDQIARQLASLPDVHEAEPEGQDSVFTVTRAGNAKHRSWDNTIIGRMVLAQRRLTVETNSTRRADSLRSAIETQLSGLVRFRLRKEENTAQMLADARAAAPTSPPPPDEAAPPELAAEMRRFKEQHMRDWLGEAIPALDGLTPREAARLPRARPKLELLLKEFEQIEARMPEEQRIDLRWLRETLGFS